ncbi:extracellular solute-binding protein [Rhizobium sp. RU36D]|uniref:extracellular solute-binding protein n=1 Tax=Rhizobium sp. RU36D TaxID=1907415 RepID=UPI0009D802D6|nr:extracellular solute-binding protein [Rhizobium sp. RU36D]SMD10144.1 microcin C transport system substrate-binding protein [Rhizobium sp. RU36D]
MVLACRLASLILSFSLITAGTPSAFAQEQDWKNGIATIGELKYQKDFPRFDYVNPDAPKGGTLRLAAEGSFDTLNPLLARGEAGSGLSLVFESLMISSEDELSAMYGLLADGVKYPADYSSVTFRLRAEAKWADGQPVTPEDVIFSFDNAKKGDPQQEFYYRHVVKAEKTGEREVTFTFDEPNNRELPQIVGQLIIVPKHWWEAAGPDGKPRDISRTTMEVPMGSGPYKISAVSPGSSITYELRPDYWGKDINVNVGRNNFGSIVYRYYADRDVMFESFRSGNEDYWWENMARRWATAYDFPAVKDGRVKREELDNEMRKVGVMVGFIFNLRREKFADPKVREALNYAFDFEELRRTIFFNSYERIDSFFFRTDLASSGLPQGRELEILNEVKDLVPAKVFTEAYTNPVNGDPAKLRENLRKAVGLLKEAGYERKGTQMVNVKTGQPLNFEIMLGGPTIEPVALAFARNLKLIGIDVTVRSVEQSQFTNRWRSRDFDVMYNAWGQSMNPGNEQAEYWGSQAAAREGSQNYSGISDPGIDALIRKVVFAKDREEQIAAVKALDRVLLAHHIVVPSYSSKSSRIAYWDTITHPANLPEFAIGMPSIWWSTKAGAN